MHSKIENCSGCKACENVCPMKCLKINITSRHHFIKIINMDQCIKCGKCIAVCPMKKAIIQKPIKGMLAWNRKYRIGKKSSSGGIASSIYLYCLKNNIDCIGVLFDKNQTLRYEFISNKESVYKAAGSKYLYSDMNNIYWQIEEKIAQGKDVVFIGLPCHVSGLKNFCEERHVEVERLYTVDLVCHGVPMPIVFEQYLEGICKKGHVRKPVDIFFRDKENPFGVTVKKNNRTIYNKSRYQDAYMIAYIEGYYMSSCYECPYATESRCSDITLKDSSSGVGVKMKEIPLHNSSEILINSVRGEELLKQVQKEGVYMQKIPLEKLIKADPMLQHPTKQPQLYTIFCKLEKMFGFEITIQLLYGVRMQWKKLKK